MAYGSIMLSLVQSVCKRSGLPPPQTVSGSSDPMYQQMMELLNEELEEVSTRFEWSDYVYQITHVTTAASNQGNLDALCGLAFGGPADGRINYILNDTIWDQTTGLPIFGPLSAQQWERYKAMPITGVLLQYRILNNNLLLYPDTTVPAGHALRWEMSTELMVKAKDDTFKRAFDNDNDRVPLHDSQMKAGLRWRWKREKGLSYAEDQARYERILADRMCRDGTSKILSLNDDDECYGPGILIPAGSWNVP